MIEKGKISSFEMAVMMFPTIMATAIITLPTTTFKHAREDLWISPILASLIGFLAVYIAWQLHRYYPKETLVQYSVRILGRVPGKLMGLVFLLFFLYVTGGVMRQYAEFIVGNFLPLTPLPVVLGSMALVSSFAVQGGVEVLARAALIFVPIVTFLLLMNAILLIPDSDPANLLPVLEHGWMPPFKGSVAMYGYFGEFIMISFLFPYVTDREKTLKWGFLSVLGVMLIMVITNLSALLVFGSITDMLTNPILGAAQYISIADFFEHLDSIVLTIWVVGTFVKITVFYYVVVLGLAQWLNLSDYRPIVLPIGFVSVPVAIWYTPSLMEFAHSTGTISPFHFTLMQIVLPAFLLLIAALRHKNKPKGNPQDDVSSAP